MSNQMTPAMRKALERAASRETAAICPIVGVYANAADVLLEAMERRGFIKWDGEPWKTAPRISDAGRSALAIAEGNAR